MDQCSQLSIEFDRLGLTDLLEGISVARDRFYLVEHLFASGKVNQEYRNGAPGPREGLRGRSANCGYDLFAQCVRPRSEINHHAPHNASPAWCPVLVVPLQVAL